MAAPALVFDLDNTLYPASSRLFDQIDARMTAFVSRKLGLPLDAARKLQKQYFVEHGTTLSGLMREHDVPAAEFLDYVHNIDLSLIPPNPELHGRLAAYKGPKIVYTNGSRRHAENVLAHMGMLALFDAIFDIEASEFRPKPCHFAFDAMLARCGVSPNGAVMFDDIPRNLEPAAAAGMTTVWICDAHNIYHTLQSRAGTPASQYIHHTLEDVLQWFTLNEKEMAS
jgi:putative hydrolase of the HAD superfamily